MSPDLDLETKKQCRYLRPDGLQCHRPALRNEFYCFHHGRDRRHLRHTRISPALIQVPLLDNRPAIQAVLTDVARGLAAGTLDLAISRELVRVLKVASQQLSKPLPSELLRPAASPAAENDPLALEEVTVTPEGDELGPDLPYHGPNGKPEREWSFSEFLYRSVFSQNPGQPLPEEGYIDPAKGPTPPPPPPAPRALSPSPLPTPAPGISDLESRAAGSPAASKDLPRPGRLDTLHAAMVAALHEPHLKPAQLLGHPSPPTATASASAAPLPRPFLFALARNPANLPKILEERGKNTV